MAMKLYGEPIDDNYCGERAEDYTCDWRSGWIVDLMEMGSCFGVNMNEWKLSESLSERANLFSEDVMMIFDLIFSLYILRGGIFGVRWFITTLICFYPFTQVSICAFFHRSWNETYHYYSHSNYKVYFIYLSNLIGGTPPDSVSFSTWS